MSSIELGGVRFESLEPDGTTNFEGVPRWCITVNRKRRIINIRILTCQTMLRAWLIRTQAGTVLALVSPSEFAAGIRFLKNQYDEKMKGQRVQQPE